VIHGTCARRGEGLRALARIHPEHAALWGAELCVARRRDEPPAELRDHDIAPDLTVEPFDLGEVRDP
jgi:hypothetical protein